MADTWLRHLIAGLSGSSVAAYVWDAVEDRYEWNGDLSAVPGLDPLDYPLNARQFHEIINPQDLPQRMAVLREVLQGVVPSCAMRYRVRSAGGLQHDVLESAVLHIDDEGRKYICGFLRLVSPAANAAQDKNAAADMAVSVSQGFRVMHHGRSLLIRRIEAAVKHIGDFEKTGYLLALGLDRLTFINESFGSSYADEVIDQTGRRLRQIAADKGYVCRIDGDVFGIFFHDMPVADMERTASLILDSFCNAPLQIGSTGVCVSFSVGGATLRDMTEDGAPSLITKAETAMQAAKEKGRCCFVSYAEAARRSESYRTFLDSADYFLQALKENRVMMAYQPIIESRTQSVKFHECLIRLVDHKGGFIAAGDFVPAIEAMGLTRFVDQYAMRMAIDELNRFPHLKLSVNVSHLTLLDAEWLRGVEQALEGRRHTAGRLILEITETAVSRDPEHTKSVIRTLKNLGCKIALDDFGAGFTAFSQLRDLEVDIVKIDKSFVRHINEAQNLLFIRTLQSLAKGVNVQTVGEGAETMADANRLVDENVDYIQGYVYGRPQVERVWLPKDHEHRHFSAGAPPFTEENSARFRIN